ncbi:RNA polymerase sigma factor [Novilysobacter arseniciresistens]|uniref:RNA polymerase sigma factor n=1 Tax=Novilysobacter arseniciresistens TaxID=1385522 RepID=UPI00055C673A|nr:sigma-70 family RNA polymerase sigma factor [Lysobacter arseniciresistens]
MSDAHVAASPLEQLVAGHLDAAAGGDRDAYGRIVAACQNPITAIALAIVRDVPASEDIAQEAFLSAWQNLRRLQNPASFLPWLRQITRNLARDHLRARRRRPREVEDADALIESAADPQPGPLGRLAGSEREAVAAELISALPDDSREVLLLYYREGQSSQQVATLLGLSDAAVRKRLSRARQCVRADLLERFGEFARGSAPSVGFTAMVAGALAVASPPAATASVLGGTLAIGGAKTLGKVVAGSAGGLGLGLAGAFAGIYLGLRSQLKGAIDEAERVALVRNAVVSGLASVGFMASLLLIAWLDDGWVLPVLATLVFMGIVFHKSMVVLPRILARRHALEAQRDPVGAARRRRRERINCWIGGIVGFGCGVGGLIVGLVSSGRL